MIYLTTFILALFLSHVTHALPQRRDPDQPPPNPLHATFDNRFDNPQGLLNGVACSDGENGLAAKFPTFGDLPIFPHIGGAFDVAWNRPSCGGCWKITNPANNAYIIFTAVDTAGAGFSIGEKAYKELNGGELGGGLVVEAEKISRSYCGLSG